MQARICGFTGLGRRGVCFVAGADTGLISEGLLLFFEKVLNQERHLCSSSVIYKSVVPVVRVKLHTMKHVNYVTLFFLDFSSLRNLRAKKCYYCESKPSPRVSEFKVYTSS